MCWWRLIVVEVAPKNFSTVASFFTCQRQTYREAIFTPEADQMVDGRKKFRRNAKKIKSGPRMNKYFLLLSDPQLSQKKNKTLLCWSRCCFFLLFILLNEFLLDQQWARLTTQKLYIHQKKNQLCRKGSRYRKLLINLWDFFWRRFSPLKSKMSSGLFSFSTILLIKNT